MASEEDCSKIEQRLQDLQKQLGKKQMFEETVSSIRSLLQIYPSSPPSLRKSFYSVVCRVATILQTRYTAPGFWLAGLRLFEDAECLVTESSQKEHLKMCIARAHEHLQDEENRPEVPVSNARRGYLFEGHLTVEPEPPPPSWLVAQNLLTALEAAQEQNTVAESSQGRGEHSNTSESSTGVNAPDILQQLINSMQDINDLQDLDSVIEASLQEIGAGPQRPPPASKEVVAKLPIITVTDDILVRLGSETECAVCREKMVINDKMQELPCKHLFHPDCLKPWLDEHNSCPICRHELQTDDHAYESWKEREKEAEEERKGAANAVRGGEYMYV
ncbi:E3 ubiquitin-protein ligase AIP2 [Cinnamomum micranthum f. kanehirae]|uniref:RING-type E3 ubiquitin transferase n=1 Tax=Cinnamomum micranthum f. kanehirae TaxID=337451 RepID=A0A3S3NIL8_9MAGN|nr:E3 ubiquitin-protein ligase AIP2 [Cinnamomum micranthum f. kanehirae]